jgi:exodeoxyribonuclease VII small subunit
MKDKDLNFEKALADLEEIVDKLEKGGLSLNESLGLFEKGVKLARFLRSELEKAEKKVEILLKNEKGEVRHEPFTMEEREGLEGAEENTDEEDSKETTEDNRNEGEPGKKTAPRGAKKKPGGDSDDKLPF